MALITTKALLYFSTLFAGSLAAPAEPTTIANSSTAPLNTSNALVIYDANCLVDRTKYYMHICIDAIGLVRELAGDRVRRRDEVVIANIEGCTIHVKIDADSADGCSFSYREVTTAASSMVVLCQNVGGAPGLGTMRSEDGTCGAGVKFCEKAVACFP